MEFESLGIVSTYAGNSSIPVVQLTCEDGTGNGKEAAECEEPIDGEQSKSKTESPLFFEIHLQQVTQDG